jgi:hypothetical protein
MTDFTLARNRDAWFVIRGYKYQIDLTILRWLSISESQTLALEFGEDIDIVNKALVGDTSAIDRELEQVKHLDRPITLRSPECISAIANAVQHFSLNPSQEIIFRFCTNSTIATERPPVSEDRSPGIRMWENLRGDTLTKPQRSALLAFLLEFIRRLDKPAEGVDENTWKRFRAFISNATARDLSGLIARFEWSTGQPSASDLSKEVLRRLQTLQGCNEHGARSLYERLFLHVSQVLSAPGDKILDTTVLDAVLARPTLSDGDARLLRVLTAAIFSQADRLEQIESTAKRHEEAIAGLRQRLLENAFGAGMSLTLSTAIADISISLPPQVQAIARRQTAVAAIQEEIASVDWCALYGSVGCGKTQLTSLIGEGFASLVYLSFRDLTALESNFLLHHLFLQLCAGKRAGSVVEAGLEALEAGTAIILDDVPRLVAGDSLAQRLVSIARRLGVKNQKLFTLSHYSIPSDVASTVPRGCFAEIQAPKFDAIDVKELFEQFGAAKGQISDKLAEMCLNAASGNPTILAAIGRKLQAVGWQNVETELREPASVASPDELIRDTMSRLLATVENEDSRELLYRLCLVLGAFGGDVVTALADVSPRVSKPQEAYSSLVGLWIEKQTEIASVVCPLIAQFGAAQLDHKVKCSVADALADMVFAKRQISPIDFTKGIAYLRRAENGVALGMRILRGLESVHELPIAWKKLIFFATTHGGLLDNCPVILGLLVTAKQIDLAISLQMAAGNLVQQGTQLIGRTSEDDRWAVVGYAAQVAPLVARHDFDEAMQLAALVLDHFEEVIQYRNEVVGDFDGKSDELDEQFLGSFVWFFVPALRNAADFMHWFELIAKQPKNRRDNILASDLAAEGLKIALDNLWMHQHELPAATRDLGPVVAAYERVSAFAESNGLDLWHALAERANIIAQAEYLHDLPRAEEIAERFLAKTGNSDENVFLISEAIGRQCLYAQHTEMAITHLRRACRLDTHSFDGLRCRAFIELSRAIGDTNCAEALELSEQAVLVARRNRHGVATLDMVSALGEAAIAAGFDGQYVKAFENIDEAFSIMASEFQETIDWKMRFVFLGNALGYLTSMASSGKPPSQDYTVPPRGHLISYNETAASWYDEADYKKFNLAPTLLATFAHAVANDERAFYWASKGIDDARSKGVLASVQTLAEMLIPASIQKGAIDQAMDLAYEAASALAASHVARRTTDHSDVRERQDVLNILGTKPSDDWNYAESLSLFTGAVPSMVYAVGEEEGREEILRQIQHSCRVRAEGASNPSVFLEIAEALEFYVTSGDSKELHERGLRENEHGNRAAMCAYYLLSSFAGNADVRNAIVQQAVAMHECSTKYPADSAVWKFLTDQLVAYWRDVFEKQRFRFLSPELVQDDLQKLEEHEYGKRLKQLIHVILRGLSRRLPAALKTTSEWLGS